MQGQITSEFQRRMEAHVVGVTRWIKELLPTLYANPPNFAPVFRDFYNQQEDHMPVQILRGQFALNNISLNENQNLYKCFSSKKT